MFTGDGYSVNVSSGKLVLYKNNRAAQNACTSFTASPKKYSTSNSISINGRPYLGKMKFTIESSKYVRPINETFRRERSFKRCFAPRNAGKLADEALKAQAVAARTYWSVPQEK